MADVEIPISEILRISSFISETSIPLTYREITSFSIENPRLSVWALLSAQIGRYGHGG